MDSCAWVRVFECVYMCVCECVLHMRRYLERAKVVEKALQGACLSFRPSDGYHRNSY